MKKGFTYLFATLMLLAIGTDDACSQHYFGIRGGTGSGSSRIFPQREMGTIWGLYSGGVSWKFYTDEKFVGGIEADALWVQQGFRTYELAAIEGSDKMERTSYYQRTVNTAIIPIMWQPHIYMFKQHLRIFANLGVTLSYVISSNEKNVDLKGGTSSENSYTMKATRDNRVGYGLCGGGGISYSAGRFEAFAEARYYLGYSDILKNRNKYEANPLRSPLDGLQFQIGVYWRVGKGNIRSAQNRPVTDHMIQNVLENNPQQEVLNNIAEPVLEEAGVVDENGEQIILPDGEEEVGDEDKVGGENKVGGETVKSENKSRKQRRRG